MKKEKYTIFYLARPKLNHTDNILPIILEITYLYNIDSIRFFYFDKKIDSSFTKAEIDLFDIEGQINKELLTSHALKDLNLEYIKLPAPNLKINKTKFLSLLYSIYRNIKILGILNSIIFQKSIIIAHKLPASIIFLKKLGNIFSKTLYFQISLKNCDKESTEFHDNNIIKDINLRPNNTDLYVQNCTAVLSSWEKNEYTNINKKNIPFVHIGYQRGLNTWQNFINTNINLYVEPEIKENFFFWPLSIEKRKYIDGQEFDLTDSSIEFLKLLKKINYPLQVVFRKHPTGSMSWIKKVCKEANFHNYVISNAHPQQLIKKSYFTFGLTSSTLFCDAWYLNKPVVQYVSDKNNVPCVTDKHGNPIDSLYKTFVDYFILFDEEKLINI
ncbi:hypothetical protein OAK17_07705, partial [Alphaproteobacteria bacterium]|nr:hypothetical protein [Alphaproteobacteria bacterium]